MSDLYQQINDFAQSTGWLHPPMRAYTNYGIVIFAGLLLAGWWVARTRPSAVMAAALIAPVATVVAIAANQPLIRAVGEPRPFLTHPNALVLVSRSADGSFPSDHATMAGAVAASLFLVTWRLGLVASALALLMAFDRVYVGVHYPQDVLAGLGFGAAVAILVWAILRIPVTHLVTWLRASRCAWLVGSGIIEPVAGQPPHT